MSQPLYPVPELLPPMPMAALAPASARAMTSVAIAGLALFGALGVWRSGAEPLRPFTAPTAISATVVQAAPPVPTPAPLNIANGQPAVLDAPTGAAAGGQAVAIVAGQFGGRQ